MSIATFEAIVEHGQIRLKPGINLPEGTKVYVVVPDVQIQQTARIASPHLAHAEQRVDFTMEITDDGADDGV